MVRLTLYNTHGRVEKEIINDYKSTGEHIEEVNVKNVPSGIYLLHIKTSNNSKTKNIIISNH